MKFKLKVKKGKASKMADAEAGRADKNRDATSQETFAKVAKTIKEQLFEDDGEDDDDEADDTPEERVATAEKPKARAQARGPNTREAEEHEERLEEKIASAKKTNPKGAATKKGKGSDKEESRETEEEKGGNSGEGRTSSGESSTRGSEATSQDAQGRTYVGKDGESGGEATSLSTVQQSSTEVVLEQRRALPLVGRMPSVNLGQEKGKVSSLPTYSCSTCSIGPECPEFKEGYVCAYVDAFTAFPVRDVDSVLALMAEVVEGNKERMRFGRIYEKIVNGGQPDPNVTRLSEVVLSQTAQLVELSREQQKVTVTVQGDTPATGTKGGLLSKLFGAPTPQNALVNGSTLELHPSPEVPGADRTQDSRGELVYIPKESFIDVVNEVSSQEGAPKGENK